MMNTDDFTNIKQIDRYLNGEMTKEESLIFEEALTTNDLLRKSFDIQKKIQEGAKRAVQRNVVRKIGKRFRYLRKIQILSVVVAGTLLTILSAYFLLKKAQQKVADYEKQEHTIALLDSLVSLSPISNCPSQFFAWKGKDSVILTKNGVLLSVTEKSFLLNGKPYAGKAIIQWQEAMDASTIMKAGLSTTSDGRMLETQGMFGLEVYTPNGKKLDVNPSEGVYVQVPISKQKKGMQLFKGVKDKQGMINWTAPAPLERLPITASMRTLNFYPKGLKDTLDKMGGPNERKYRDSLYLQVGIEPIHNVDYTWEFTPYKKFGEKIQFADYFKKESNWTFTRKSSGEYSLEGKLPLFNSGRVKYFNCKGNQKWLFCSSLLRTITDYEFVINREINLEMENLLNKGNEFSLSSYSSTCEYPAIKYTLTVNNKQYTGNVIISTSDGFDRTTFAIEESHQDIIKQLRLDDNFTMKFEANQNEYKIASVFDIKFTSKKQDYRFPFILMHRQLSTKKKEEHYGCAVLKVHETATEVSFLSPSKVLAFWKDQFNNTNLATRDFEKRMQVIHQICSSNCKATTTDLLKLYTNNLDKPIHYADVQAVKLGFNQFQSFVDEQVGLVNTQNNHVKNLQAFYEKSVQLLEDELIKNKGDVELMEGKLRDQLYHEREKEKPRTSNREKQNFEEEKNLNLKDVYKQLDYEHVVGFTITESAQANVYNIDRFVEETTKERKTASYTVPTSGKTVTITYNPFSLEVEDYKKYNQLFVYLLPSKMNSFQRLKLQNGKLDYPLNNLLEYDVVVLGMTNNEYYIYTQKSMRKGNLGKLTLSSIQELKLNNLLKKLTQKRDVDEPMSFKEELQWLKTEMEYTKFQSKKLENQRFINRLRKIVFPCWSDTTIYI